MTRESLLADRVIAVCNEVHQRPAFILTPDSELTADAGFDPLDRLTLALGIEDTFGVFVSDATLGDLTTVQDVIDLVYEHEGDNT